MTISSGRARQALYQPRQRSAADHAWRAIGRCRPRFGCDLGARRSSRRACRSRSPPPTASAMCARACSSTRFRNSDFTAKALLEDLPAGQDIFYRMRFMDHSAPTILSEPVVGRFRTAPSDKRAVSFIWGGDVGGQGWGIDEAKAGCASCGHHAQTAPGFFHPFRRPIYADVPLRTEVKLTNGQSLEERRHRAKIESGRDARRFSRLLQIQSHGQERARVQCGDPDIRPMGRSRGVQRLVTRMSRIGRGEHRRRKLTEKNMMTLAARAGRAFHEYMPIRGTPAEPARSLSKTLLWTVA